jgi:cytochrome c peroxidase
MLKMIRLGTIWIVAITLIAALTATRLAAGKHNTNRDELTDAVRNEVKSVELEIDRIEAESLNKAPKGILDRFEQITLLGKIIFYDKQLSVNRNEACSFCHMAHHAG